MTQNTPGSTGMSPDSNRKPKQGNVVYSTDGKVLTDPEQQNARAGNTQGQANPEVVEEGESQER